MKQKKGASAKRAAPAAAARKVAARRRPLHKRMLLHPFTVMVLLCAGVLIAGSTFHSSAASYDVTASVPAVPPATAAVITDPVSQQHVSDHPIVVHGTCPPASYVKLYRDGSFSGTGLCTANTFQVQTDLYPGANSLHAKVYNLTDAEGPTSVPITVYYDQTTLAPAAPAAVPTQLQISNVEAGQYAQGKIQQTSVNPTITGLAPPYADVVVTFHSDVVTCLTKADADGWWSCTLQQQLPVGIHHVDVTATMLDGTQLFFPSFEIKVAASLPNITKKRSAPFLIQSEYTYQAHKPGQTFTFNIGVGGGQPPFAVQVDWGDSQKTTLQRTDWAAFTITHTYESAADYPVIITMTDNNGTATTLQLLAVVRQSLTPVAAVNKGSRFDNMLTGLKNYLWIIWPVYIAVVLMACSYWIGEQEAYRRLFGRRSAHSGGKSKR